MLWKILINQLKLILKELILINVEVFYYSNERNTFKINGEILRGPFRL